MSRANLIAMHLGLERIRQPLIVIPADVVRVQWVLRSLSWDPVHINRNPQLLELIWTGGERGPDDASKDQ